MANLKHAHNELYRRGPDECFASLQELWEHCRKRKHESTDRWHPPQLLKAQPAPEGLSLAVGNDGAFAMNDWSFSQLADACWKYPDEEQVRSAFWPPPHPERKYPFDPPQTVRATSPLQTARSAPPLVPPHGGCEANDYAYLIKASQRAVA
jgi:hypothetical protein